MDREMWYVLGGLLLLCVGALWGGAVLNRIACEERWSEFGQVKYSMTTGCMVHYKGKWTPATAIREI